MQTVNIHEAKTQLSKQAEAVSQGEKIVIAKAGKPVRQPGVLKGKLRIAEDFDGPLPDDVLAAFEGGE